MAKYVEIQTAYDLEPGAVLTIGQPPDPQRLRLLERLGGGITSQVWRAEMIPGDENVAPAVQGPVAIKLMTLAVERPERRAFLQETQVLAQLSNALSALGEPDEAPPLVPRLLGQREKPWPAFILMSLASGSALDQYLRQDRYMAEQDGLLVTRQLCLLFRSLHEELKRSYPDFQLHNIFWDSATRRICVVGWDRLAPAGQSDFEADIASVARLAYRMLLGVEYAGQPEASERWGHLSAPVRELLTGWLQGSYTSFAALHARLAELTYQPADEALSQPAAPDRAPAAGAAPSTEPQAMPQAMPQAAAQAPLEAQASQPQGVDACVEAVCQELQTGDPEQFGQQSILQLGADPHLSRLALDTLKGLYQAGYLSRASAGLGAVFEHLAPALLDEARALQQRLQESAAWWQIVQQAQQAYTQKTASELRSTPFYQEEILSGVEKLALAPADEPARAQAWKLALRMYFEEKLPAGVQAQLYERALLRLEPRPGMAQQARQANRARIPLSEAQAGLLEKITQARLSIDQPSAYSSHAELQLAIDQLAEAIKDAQYLPMFPSLSAEISAQIQALHRQHERISEHERMAEIQRLCAQAGLLAHSELEQELQDALGLLAQANQLALGLPAQVRQANLGGIQVQIEQVKARQAQLERSRLLAQARRYQQTAEKLAAAGDGYSLEAASEQAQKALALAGQLGDKGLAAEFQAQIDGYQGLLESQRAARIHARVEAELQIARQSAAVKTIPEQEAALQRLGGVLAAAQDELHDPALVKTVQDEQQQVRQELLQLRIATLRQQAQAGLQLQTSAGCELALRALHSALELAQALSPKVTSELEKEIQGCHLTQAWLRYTAAAGDIQALEQRARKLAAKDNEAAYTEALELLEQALSQLGAHTWEGKTLDPDYAQRLEFLRDNYRQSIDSKRTHLVVQRLGQKEQEAQVQLEQRTPESYRKAKKALEAAAEIASDELKDSERAQVLHSAAKEVEREIQVQTGGPAGYRDRVAQAEELCAQKVLVQIQQAMPLYTQAVEVARKAGQLALVENAEGRIQELKKVITRAALLRRQIVQHRQQQNYADALKGIAELHKLGIYGFEKQDDLEYLEQYVHFELYEQQFLEAYAGWSVKLPAEEKASRKAQMEQALDDLEKLASSLDDNQQRRLVEYRKDFKAIR